MDKTTREDSEDIVIHPRKGRKDVSVPERIIFIPNPTEARLAHDEMRRRGADKLFLYNSALFVDPSERVAVAGPALGAPAAGLVLEKLIVQGASRINLFSCCGTINQTFRISDIVLGVSGVSGEGVSCYYEAGSKIAADKRETARMRSFLSHCQLSWQEGTIWSTDAPYRESRTLLQELRRNDGVDCVDMEFTALCSIAAFRNVSLSALFVVSDELWGTQWNPGFGEQRYRDRCRFLLSDLIDFNREN